MSREKATKVADGRVVVLRYALSTADGVRIDEATEGEPFVYLHGRGAVPPKLALALEGREAGERFEVALSGPDAFGPKVADAERVLPRDVLPEGKLPRGLQIMLRVEDALRPAWLVRETVSHVVVSLSHPLAADPAVLEAEVLRVRDATAAELEQGWAVDTRAAGSAGEVWRAVEGATAEAESVAETEAETETETEPEPETETESETETEAETETDDRG